MIHVQGIRTSRAVALRTVAAARDAGVTSLVITYRGSGDGPPTRASMLAPESESSTSVAYARANGAKRVTIAAWSMGAALTLEMLRHDPGIVDDLVLICPVSDWPATIAHGANRPTCRSSLPTSQDSCSGPALVPLCSAYPAKWTSGSWLGRSLAQCLSAL